MNFCANWNNKNFSFFQHTGCEYFPCHSSSEMDPDSFNCLFCFCPLYEQEDCGGIFYDLDGGRKDCSLCVLPHKKENYGFITQRLREAKNNAECRCRSFEHA